MPKRPKTELLDKIVQAIGESGWNVLYLSRQHPFRLHIFRDDANYRVRIYLWNLTHGGGRARPQGEYRIQITGVSRFEPELGGKTLILGWWDEVGVFAGFDYNKHSGPLGASPSIQIREENLRKAHLNGFSPYNKGNQEVAIAFKPDFLVEYIRNLDSLHGFGVSEQDLEILDAVADDPQAVNDVVVETVSQPRQITVAQVRRRLRESSFQARILTAYGHRCAVCGLQLDLVEAAHIIPVYYDDSTDETSNGIALCVLHHRAYDRALITIDEKYYVQTNETQLKRLKEIGHDGEMDRFIQELRPLILLPPAVTDRPLIDYIRTANNIRGWKK